MAGFAVYGRTTARPGRHDALVAALRDAVTALGEPVERRYGEVVDRGGSSG